MTENVDYGQPCKRCYKPMVPTHGEIEPGYVAHNNDGFCITCIMAMRRPVIRRAALLVTDDGIIDEVAVERARKGDLQCQATEPELWAAVMHLSKMALSEYDCAHILGMPLAFIRGQWSA